MIDEGKRASRDAAGKETGPMPKSDGLLSDILSDDRATLIAPYVSKNSEIFQCPADPRYGPYDGAVAANTGKNVHAARSISMNQGVGTIDLQFLQTHTGHSGPPRYPPERYGDYLMNRLDRNYAYRQAEMAG